MFSNKKLLQASVFGFESMPQGIFKTYMGHKGNKKNESPTSIQVYQPLAICLEQLIAAAEIKRSKAK